MALFGSLERDWIVSPRYDLLFFSSLWLLPLLVVVQIGAEQLSLVDGLFTIWFFHLFIRLPHFAATLKVTYLRTEHRAHYRKHWILYFAVPALILGVYAIPSLTSSGFATPWGQALVAVAHVWGYYHIGMQNYGILQVYRGRSKAERETGPKIEKTVYWVIVLAIVISNEVWPYVAAGGSERAGAFLNGLTGPGQIALVAVLCVIYGKHLRRSRSFSVAALLYFAVSIVAMVKWPFYDSLPEHAWFFVFNGHHSLAYLGLVLLMEWNRKHPGERFSMTAAAPAYLRGYAPLVLAGLAMILAAKGFALIDPALKLNPLLGFFVAHYYVEALVWKFRNPHNRKVTLPLLRQPNHE